MGLFSFTKSQLLKSLEWADDSKNTIVYKYPIDGRNIMMGSKLTVRESQVAIFVNKGKIADVFEPGYHKLSTSNLPILTKLLSLPYGFNSPFYADVYFINTKQFTGQKWGTSNPITMRDAEFGTIRLRGFGTYAFKVENPTTFLKELFGTNSTFKTTDITDYLKSMLVATISDCIAESKISALDLASNLLEFNQVAQGVVNEQFSKLGLTLTNLVIENLSFPEEVEKAIDTRSSMGVLEDSMDTFVKYQAAHAMREGANNPNGNNLAGLGVGIAAGTSLGGLFSNSIKGSSSNKIICPKCGAETSANSNFCAECGNAIAGVNLKNVCSKCGSELSPNAKFCGECGTKVNKNKICKKCDTVNSANSKFCSNCGAKV